MTREERLELLKQIEKDIHVCSLESTLLEDAKSCAIHSAIEELEEKPILDKIRAEVMNLTDGETPERIWNVDVLQIIDKYKGETEDKK